MNTIDLQSQTSTQLANIIRGMQEDRGLPISAVSTIIRQKKVDLIASIQCMQAGAEPAPAESRFVGEPGSTVPLTVAETQDMQETIDAEGIDSEETEEEPVVNGAAAPANPPASAKKRMGAAPNVADHMVITVLAPSNPRRPGTAGYKRFSLFTTGMTVGQYVEAVKQATHNSDGNARGTLNKSIRKGHVRVDAPAA